MNQREITELIDTLHATEQRLEALTVGQVDAVSDRRGRSMLLRRAQEHLRASDATRQAAILDALPAYIALLDSQGFVASANEAWLRFEGPGAAEAPGCAVGADYLSMCDRGQQGQVAAGVRAVLGGESTSFSTEYRWSSPAGPRWFLMTVIALAERVPRGAVVMHVDITAPRQRDEQLHDFAAAMDSVSDAIYLIDRASMDFAYVNDAACRMQGRTRAELFALRPEGVLGVPRAELERTYDAVIAAGVDPAPIEMTRTRADGREVLVDMRRHALRTGDRSMIVTVVRDITERRDAEAKLGRLNRVHAVLSGINALIVRATDRDDLFRDACRIAVEQGGFRMAWIGLLEQEGTVMKPMASAGVVGDFFETAPLEAPTWRTSGKSIVWRAIGEGKPVVCDDVRIDPRIQRPAALEFRGIRSLVAIPLLAASGSIGVLTLYAPEEGYFDAEETRLLVDLAGNISFALEQIGKEDRVRRLTRVHAMLSGVSSLIVRVRDSEALFQGACRTAVEQGGFLVAWIAVLDRKSGVLEPVASAGDVGDFFASHKLGSPHNSPGGLGLPGRAIREMQPMIANDVRADPSILRKAALASRGVNSAAHIPLVSNGEAIGVLALYAADIGFFDDEEVRLLQGLCADISFAVDNLDKESRLNYLANYDLLTGLANRSLFVERVAQHLLSAPLAGCTPALFLIDLERFKDINDSFGREEGDALLRQVAAWLAVNAAEPIQLARVGPDVFGLILPDVKTEGEVAKFLDETMRALLAHSFRMKQSEFRIAAKIGVALFPADAADADTLFRNAEAALKKAKASGDRYLFYAQRMTESVAGRLALENQLRQALANEEFVLHYQPKVSLASGALSGVEALIRWNDPRTGLVPPGRFIPILEESGLIYDVGRWALRTAIGDYLRWRAAGLPVVRVAVNVSPLQLRNPGFVEEIRQAIGVDAHAAGGLELEITEGVIMEAAGSAIATLQAIRAMGVTIAIDDFGTGFSSLSYLSRLPVDTLKVDRSFVVDMTASPAGLAIVSTIVALAHSLKLKVVAEGVETEEQSRLLRLINCDEMQGYLFSRPVPSADFEERFLASVR